MVGLWDEQALRELHWHWGDAYDISLAGATWTARFMGDDAAEMLSAPSADDLRDLIRTDYQGRNPETL